MARREKQTGDVFVIVRRMSDHYVEHSVRLDVGGQCIYPEGVGVLLTFEDHPSVETYEISVPKAYARLLAKRITEAADSWTGEE